MAAERHRDRDTERRRAAGALDRETYLEAVQQGVGSKQEQAQVLRAQGLSVRAIAEQMGISKTAAGRYIQAANASV